MRLIDADELEKRIWELPRHYLLMDDTRTADVILQGLYRVGQMLDDIPTADVVPIRHRHWKMTKDEYGVCDGCGHIVDLMDGSPHNYCPECGARMEEKE